MAGRKDKNTVDYFPHYVYHGKTLFIIESKFGNDGYAAWFKILEELGSSEHHYIDCRKDEDWEYLNAKIKLMHTSLREILDLCSKLGAINKILWENKVIFSENFVKNITDAYKRRSSKCPNIGDVVNIIGIDVSININNDNNNTQSKVKERKVKERKVNNIKSNGENDESGARVEIEEFKEVFRKYPGKTGASYYQLFNTFQKFCKKYKLNEKEELDKVPEAIEKYKIYVETQRSEDFKELKYKNCSTWINNGCWQEEIINVKTLIKG